MNALLPEKTMARRNDVSVKMDQDVVRIARLVAEYKQITIAEYLSELVRPVAQRDLAEEQAKFKLGGSRPTPKAPPKRTP